MSGDWGETIEAVNGLVSIDIGGGYERESETYAPDVAREFAARIIAEADKCDAQKAAIEAACADGHDWGSGCNGYLPWPDTKVCSYWCKREGCNGRKVEQGWIEFAGQLHVRMGQQVDCLGPGCEYCDEERFGKAMMAYLVAGARKVDAWALGLGVEPQ